MQKKIEKRLKLKKNVRNFLNKILITTIIFLIGLIIIKDNPNIKRIIKENIYEKSFKFMKSNNFYNKYIGNIFSLDKMSDKTEAVFNENINYENITNYKDGAMLTVQDNYLIPALNTGIVLFIGEKDDYGKTIIVEQIDGVEVYYSNVKENVKLYDYVEKGQLIGEASSNKIYLTFIKDGKYLNYKNYL